MICKSSAKSYSQGGWTGIENYEKAIADKKQMWHLHHRLETFWWFNTSAADLKEHGLYYNRPPSELQFLSPTEHMSLHRSGCHKIAPISQYKLDGEYVGTYINTREASDLSGVPPGQIWACLNGRAKSARGYLWKTATWDELRKLFGLS